MKENSRLRKVVHFSKYSNEFYLTENRVCEITVFGFIIFVFIPFRASFSTDLLSSLCKRLSNRGTYSNGNKHYGLVFFEIVFVE